jgi:hypothetical protein
MQTSRPVFAAVVIISLCAFVLTTPLRSQVPDCSQAPFQLIPPASKLSHFCGNRVPGRFFVKIKDKYRLAKDVPPRVENRLGVLPGLVPHGRKECISLGRALAEKYHAIFSDNHCRDDCRYFSIQDLADSDAAAMALDPRIEYIEPDKLAILQ